MAHDDGDHGSGDNGHSSPPSRPLASLARELVDPDPRIRADAAWAMGPFRWLAVPYLARALQDDEAEVRRSAALTLAEMGPEAAEAVPVLLASLDDPSPEVREEIVATLGAIGEMAVAAAGPLTRLLSEESVALVAAEALGKLGAAGLDGLLTSLGSSQPTVRAAGAAGLGALEAAALPAIPRLLALLDADPAFVRSEVVRSLGRIAPEHDAVGRGLLARLGDESSEVRRRTAAVLADADPSIPGLIEGLRSLSDDEDQAVRTAATEALVRLGHRTGETLVVPVPEVVLRVAALSDIPPGGVHCIEAQGVPIALFEVRGTIHALEDRCPHAGAPLSRGVVDGDTVSCTRHWARFDLRSGRSLGPPAREGVRVFPVTIEGTAVHVTMAEKG